MDFYNFNDMRFASSSNDRDKRNQNLNRDNINTNNFSGMNNGNVDSKVDFDKYMDCFSKSEDELKKRLNDSVNDMKAQGNFDINAIENFYNQASSYLSQEQRDRMRAIIDMLKGE